VDIGGGNEDMGATDFENDYYKVKMIGGWQQEVLVTFKQKPKRHGLSISMWRKICNLRFLVSYSKSNH
jgi:hypothetical protein